MAAPKAQVVSRYTALCAQPSDINEHLPTLRRYAAQSSSVVEMGVRGVVSSWALLLGLIESSGESTSLIGVDIESCAYEPVIQAASANGVDAKFILGDSAKVDVPPRDLLFIDTWHVYGHLKRELAKHHASTRKYIILHDTVQCLPSCASASDRAADLGIPHVPFPSPDGGC